MFNTKACTGMTGVWVAIYTKKIPTVANYRWNFFLYLCCVLEFVAKLLGFTNLLNHNLSRALLK